MSHKLEPMKIFHLLSCNYWLSSCNCWLWLIFYINIKQAWQSLFYSLASFFLRLIASLLPQMFVFSPWMKLGACIIWDLIDGIRNRSLRCNRVIETFNSRPFNQGKGDFLLYGFCMLGAVLGDLNYVWVDWIVYVTVNKENMWLWGHIMIWLMI